MNIIIPYFDSTLTAIDMKTASWVVIEIKTGNVMFETFSQSLVNAISDKYKAVPILEYLQSVNAKIKAS